MKEPVDELDPHVVGEQVLHEHVVLARVVLELGLVKLFVDALNGLVVVKGSFLRPQHQLVE